MSEKHTKGPWHVEYELDENKEKTDLIFVAHTETECDMTAVAHILNMSATDEENKANGYLIAAAPDMLEALQSIFKEFGADEIVHYDVMEKVVNAINKARN